MPHYDALVLTLCISSFDVHMVLVDPGRAADLLQLPAFEHMKFSLGMLKLNKADPLRLQQYDYHNTRRCRSPYDGWANDFAGSILNCRRLRTLQRHNRAGFAALDESYPFNMPPNGQLFD